MTMSELAAHLPNYSDSAQMIGLVVLAVVVIVLAVALSDGSRHR